MDDQRFLRSFQQYQGISQTYRIPISDVIRAAQVQSIEDLYTALQELKSGLADLELDVEWLKHEVSNVAEAIKEES